MSKKNTVTPTTQKTEDPVKEVFALSISQAMSDAHNQIHDLYQKRVTPKDLEKRVVRALNFHIMEGMKALGQCDLVSRTAFQKLIDVEKVSVAELKAKMYKLTRKIGGKTRGNDLMKQKLKHRDSEIAHYEEKCRKSEMDWNKLHNDYGDFVQKTERRDEAAKADLLHASTEWSKFEQKVKDFNKASLFGKLKTIFKGL